MMIKFIDFSKHEKYLKSPKTWLHLYKKDYKILYFLLQLSFLPFIASQYIFFILILYFIILHSMSIPHKVKKKCRDWLIFFIVIGLINLFISIQANHTFKDLVQLRVQIFLSTLRLLLISIIHLVVMQTFLLTTNYETIISFFSQTFLLTNFFFNKVKLSILLSSQLLKIFFLELFKIQVSYYIRGGLHTNNYKILNKHASFSFLYLLNSYSYRLFYYVNYITYSLYSRSINTKRLFLIN